MRRSEIIIGSAVLGIGVLLLVGAVFNIDIWGLICPAGLIALGIWLIYRTRQDPRDGEINIKFVGDIRREGVWQVQNEETWGFVLESRLDFTEADLPEGQTIFRVGAFVNDIKATFPVDVGIAIYSMAFMTDSRIQGEKQETFFIPFTWESDNFESASKKVLIKPTCFVSEIKIEQVEIEV
ncbi:LiaF domain-containing protein [Chloroflexota bacterium]